MIDAVIFDLDGLLVDSEPCWQRAQREVFTSLGVPLTNDDARSMVGLRIADHVCHWYARYPWPSPSPAEVTTLIMARALELIQRHGKPLPAARKTVRALARTGVPLAVASSSTTTVINAALEQLRLREYFDIVQSAEREPAGKPHPGVYLSAAKALGVQPLRCIAFEDSLNGVLAAKAAGMACIAVPAPPDRYDTRFGAADAVIGSLADLNIEFLTDIVTRPIERRRGTTSRSGHRTTRSMGHRRDSRCALRVP